ncbi:MAG: YSC84-related protein [Pyrinomonadaceae bacterium]
MKIIKLDHVNKLIAVWCVLAFAFATGFAQMSTDEVREQRAEGIQEVADANRVFEEIMSSPDQTIPEELLENATAIGIFPNVMKAAFLVGGRGGDGVIVRRTATGEWSTPVFYNMGGASFGPQIGAKSTDYIMLFMNEGALQELLDDDFAFGGDVSFAAGPVGRTAAASTNLTLDAGILSWSRSEGAFIGASLKGASLDADNSINQAFYKMDARQLLGMSTKPTLTDKPMQFDTLSSMLTRYSGTSTTNKATSSMAGNGVVYVNSNMNRYRSVVPMSGPHAGSRHYSSVQSLARRVRNELLTLPYYSVFDWIKFDVSPTGVVTLRGRVTTPPDTISRAESYVEDVNGVTEVVNMIEPLPVSPMDDRLRRALYREVYSGPLFRYQVGALQNIHIIVENGRVTLEGVVDSEADKNIAGIRAKTVPGTFGVTNNIMVRPDAS